MLHYNNISIFLFLSTLLCLHPSLNATNNRNANHDHLITDSCKKISDNDVNVKYDFCVKSLEIQSSVHPATNVVELGQIAFEMTNIKQGQILIYIKAKKLVTVDPSTKAALNACLDAYYVAGDAVRVGWHAYEDGDYVTAHSSANAALLRPYDCENGFKTSPIAMTHMNLDYFQMAAICIGFCDLVYKG